MIPIYRKIRKKMADDNKPMKYMRYAIGEILLVMVGILLALQVNNWNESRIAKNEEKVIINNIHNEFLFNKKTLETSISENKVGFKFASTIFNLIGKDRSELKEFNIDSLLYRSLEFSSFRPSVNTISDLAQSGKLNLIQNEKLKNLIFDWTMEMKTSMRSFERVELKIDNELVPYLSKRYALKDIDIYGDLKWEKKSTLKVDKFKIFEDIEFESILDDYLYRMIGGINQLKELDYIIDAILKETKND